MTPPLEALRDRLEGLVDDMPRIRRRVIGHTKSIALTAGVCIALGAVLVVLFSDAPAPVPTAADAKRAVDSAAAAESGRFQVELRASNTSKIPLVTDGEGEFDRGTEGDGDFYLELASGTGGGTVAVSTRNGQARSSASPLGRIGALGPDSLRSLLEGTARNIEETSSDSDQQGLVSNFFLSPGVDDDMLVVLIDLLLVTPEGRRLMSTFDARRDIPVQVETDLNSDGSLNALSISYESGAEEGFSVRIQPTSLNAPLTVRQAGGLERR